jgi:farnesyl-diphosphate farnesyltransferase
MGVLSLLLKHPGDLVPRLKVKSMADKAKKLPKEPNLAFCYDMLNKVSRSFAIVIQQLPHELQDAVCIFYLVLRALDTVEDDMSIPDDVKCPELEVFYKKIYDKKYTYPCGEKHYKVLMDEYPKVTAVFLSLKKEYRDVIADITKRMGRGMSNFIKREVVSLDDWNEYCHYVAGLVGIGLSNLWASSMLEDKRFADMEDLSNSMGLFLQKTNIIRDYLEDIVEEPAPRMFWPKVIWSKYAKSLDAFQYPENREKAVHCANHLITNALEHAGASLEYMESLKNIDVFRFCAIPQVMAIATLAECYENGKIFEGVVKIRRGLSARIMLQCLDIYDVARMFKTYTEMMEGKIKPGDPNAKETRKRLASINKRCDEILSNDVHGFGNKFEPIMHVVLRFLVLFMTLLYAAYAFKIGPVREYLGVAKPSTGVTAVDNAETALASLAVVAASAFFATGHLF